ncbi:hypothetical protein M3231_05145 [Neobacillus mesonae]|nr:hypothetical protein [Neobacillus mesonae]
MFIKVTPDGSNEKRLVNLNAVSEIVNENGKAKIIWTNKRYPQSTLEESFEEMEAVILELQERQFFK